MPGYRKRKNYGYRRKFKKGGKRTNRIRGIKTTRTIRSVIDRPISKTAFPSSNIVRMRYANDFTLTPPTNTGLGEYSQTVISASSIFSVIGAGQPMGHDEWAQFYNRYTVMESYLKLSIMQTTTGTVPVNAGVFLNNTGAATATDYNVLIMQGKNNYRSMQPAINGMPVFIRQNYDAPKWHVIADVQDNESVGAAFTADPVDEVFFVVWAAAQHAGVSQTIYFHAVVDFIVLLQDPIELIVS